MLKRGEQYDVICVDGPHPFHIDLPAMILVDKLLKPGGHLLLDDIPWTLNFLKANMMRSLSQWYFYRTMYNFSDYTEEQQSLPHIKMIAEETHQTLRLQERRKSIVPSLVGIAKIV